MENRSIYQDIAMRTGGDIYLGLVGPVRTGKSTFIKKFMETLVIPNIDSDDKTRLVPISGTPIDLLNMPKGCAFAPRCNHACEACRSQLPPTERMNGTHAVACLRWRELSETKQGGQ